MSGIDDELRRWLEAYLRWIENGAETNGDFTRDHGLCIQPSLRDAELVHSLKELLIRTRGTDLYPFNDSSHTYWEDTERSIHHLNERRLSWVREMVA